jgi:pyrroloquinoline quinone (PQQ) biosynthesis protein C
MDELRAYAAQYRHFERYLPSYLERLVAILPDGDARTLMQANLADELGDPVPHVQLFERFAVAIGAEEVEPSLAMAALLGTYEALLDEGSTAALAGLVGYEAQASEVAARKASGLREHHGLADEAVSFWTHHAEADVRHGSWSFDALASWGTEWEELALYVRRTAEGWWAFLDEREALTAAAVD